MTRNKHSTSHRLAWCAALLLCSISCVNCSEGSDPYSTRPRLASADAPTPERMEDALEKLEAYRKETLLRYRWSEGSGAKKVGKIHLHPDSCGAESAVGESGITHWRYRDDAGDYIECEPWLTAPDGKGRSLGKPDVYLYTTIGWLPGEGLLAMNHDGKIRILDPAGRTVRKFAASPNPKLTPVAMAVNPENGRIAVLLLGADIIASGGEAPGKHSYALAILSQEGEALATAYKVGEPVFGDGFLHPPRLHWLPDNTIAMVIRTFGVERGKLVIVDPAKGKVRATGIQTYEIAGVHPSGSILLDDGRSYHPATRKVKAPTLKEEYRPSTIGYSRDGRRYVVLKSQASKDDFAYVIDRWAGRWEKLGTAIPLGWAPDGSLYFARRRKQE